MPLTELASQTLDALVAEKVMGWTWYKPPAHLHLLSYWTDGVERQDAQSVTLPHECTKGTWSPSSSIAAAWEVVEKFSDPEHGSFVDLWRRSDGWHCEIRSDTGNGFSAESGLTAPLAICLAALKAIGVTDAL